MPPGDCIRFWVGADPVDAVVAKGERQNGGYIYRFLHGAPAATRVGTAVTAIDVRNAEDVRIHDNAFEGYTKRVMIDGKARPWEPR